MPKKRKPRKTPRKKDRIRNLGYIGGNEVTPSELKADLHGCTYIRFTFITDFYEILDMGFNGHYDGEAVSGVNEKVDEVFNEYCPEAMGSLSDLAYKVDSYDKKSGSIYLEVLASVADLELVDAEELFYE